MNTKFTKGPWFAKREGFSTVYIEARLRGGMLQEVAACGPAEEPDQQEANAALIASAPELYEALKEAAECIGDLSQGKGGWDYEGVIQGIEALLEKARGEA